MVLQGLVCVHSGVASLSFRSGPEQRSTRLGNIRGKSPQPLRILNALVWAKNGNNGTCSAHWQS